MKNFCIITLLSLAAVSGRAQSNAPVTLPPPGYKLVWSDEFSGNGLDTNKWDFRTDSKMWSTQKPENVSVRDGKLFLAVKKEDAGDKHYTGAGVISKQAFKYGYYEARFKVPPGAGWHTSFWMQKHDSTGGTEPQTAAQELDVCENDSVSLVTYGVNVHKWNPPPHLSLGHKTVKTPDLSAEFHTFGCEFTPKTVKYYFEGKLVQTVAVTNFAHGDQHIWLTTIASSLGGTKAVDNTQLPAAAEYDYVRFYEKSNATGEVDINSILQPISATAKWADTNYDIWRGPDSYWAVVKDNDGNFTHRGYSLALFESADGFDWKLAKHPLVANPESIRWADGHEEKLTALERPQVVFENGEPIALCCAAANNKSRDGSFNVQIPLNSSK